MGEVKYWDGEDFTVLDSKNAQSINGIKFRINVDLLEYSKDGLTWNAQSNFSGSYNDLSNKPTIPSDTNQLAKTDVYTKTEVNDLMSSAGLGDMLKSVYDQNGNGIVDNAEKVNGFTVGINVPSDAKFTDTVYSHPASHSASMITGLPTKLSELQNDIGAGAGLSIVTSSTEPTLNTGDQWHREI